MHFQTTAQRLRKKLRAKAEMAASDSSTSTPSFKVKDNVLCFYGALLYEGKVLRIRSSKREGVVEYEYLIHYVGWKKHWDEWVPSSRLLEITVRNRQRMTDLRIEYDNKLGDANEMKRKLRKRKSRVSRPTYPSPYAGIEIAAPAVSRPQEPSNHPNEDGEDEIVILSSSFAVDNKQPCNTAGERANETVPSDEAEEIVPSSITKLCSMDDSLIMKIVNLAKCDTVDFTSAFGSGNNSSGGAGPSASECVAGPSSGNRAPLAGPNRNVDRHNCGLTFASPKRRKPLNTMIKVEKDGDGTTTISIKIKQCSEKKFGGASGPDVFRLEKFDPKEKLTNSGLFKMDFFLLAGLEAVLRQDMENTTQRGLVVKLPADYSITDILEHFLTSEGHKSQFVADVCDVFHQAFHKIIDYNLLFKEEEGQYLQIVRKLATPEWKDKSICDVYGVLHLLRLHIVLPGYLQWNSVYGNQRKIELDFFRLPVFLWKNRQTYFVNLYEAVE